MLNHHKVHLNNNNQVSTRVSRSLIKDQIRQTKQHKQKDTLLDKGIFLLGVRRRSRYIFTNDDNLNLYH